MAGYKEIENTPIVNVPGAPWLPAASIGTYYIKHNKT